MNQIVRPPKAFAERQPALPLQQPPYRRTVAQYHRMAEGGIFPADARVELLEGYLVAKMTQNPPHAMAIRQLNLKLSRLLPEDWLVCNQNPITLKESEPEPDISIVRAPNTLYTRRHPGPRDTALVIEVADSSLLSDRCNKGMVYAQAKIPSYWIVNLVDEVVEVYTAPRAGKQPNYQERQDYGRSAFVPLSLGGQDFGRLAVQDLLP
jgi:Uma2 family endonuclease